MTLDKRCEECKHLKRAAANFEEVYLSLFMVFTPSCHIKTRSFHIFGIYSFLEMG